MLPKYNKIPLDRQTNENDSLSPELKNQNPNFDISNFNNFTNQNQLKFLDYNNSSLNNNYLLNPSLNNNINIEKEIDNLINQSKSIISDGKTYYLDLPSIPSINTSNNNIKINNQELFFKENTSFQNSDIQKPINAIKPYKKPTGRIKKEDKKDGKHNKYSDDNVRKKVKHIILKTIMKFLNMKIKAIYNNNIGNNILKKELLTLNKIPKFESSIEYNKLLLNKTIKEIFSENISSKFTNYQKDFNKKLIEKLINEEDKEKREYFKALFNLTLLDCLRHFNKDKYFKELDGMECIDDVLEEFNNDKEYKKILHYNIQNFDIIINNKRSRNSKKKGRKKKLE